MRSNWAFYIAALSADAAVFLIAFELCKLLYKKTVSYWCLRSIIPFSIVLFYSSLLMLNFIFMAKAPVNVKCAHLIVVAIYLTIHDVFFLLCRHH
jgi:hypothetical protein